MRSFATILCLTALFPTLAAVAIAEEGFRPLFDGKTLGGWHGDADCWSVENGVIVGSTDNKDLKHNTFLATKETYKNFVLKLKFKLRNGNSGVQIRSQQRPDYVVAGYQADIDGRPEVMGVLWEEWGRGVLNSVDPEGVAKHMKKDDWNEYVIICNGPRIKQILNGYTTIDYTEQSDKGATEGIIALQLHAGPKMKISFKDIMIKKLP